MAISTIPAASSPISAELSPISAGLSPTPEAIGGRAVTYLAMPIVALLTKLSKTLLNRVKYRETLVKHYDTL